MKLPDLASINRELARRSLSEFVKQAWPLVEPSVPLKWTWHIPAICDHLQAVTEGRIKRLIINVPPGHIKSILTCVMWPAWEWIHRPEERTLFASYDLKLSRRDSIRRRNLVGSEWYQALLPRGEDGKPAWSIVEPDWQTEFHNSAKGFTMATATEAGATGHRGHKTVVDDPLKAGDAHRMLAKERSIEWYDKTLSSRLVEPKTGSRVLIMQRLAVDDLSGHLLDRGGYDHLCLPSEYEGGDSCACPPGTRCSQRGGTSIGFVDPRTEAGELLNPLFFDAGVIGEAKIELGSDYVGQHGQRPTPREGAMLKIAWMGQRYKHIYDGPGEWRIYGDLKNGSKRPRSSYAVFGAWFIPFMFPARRYLVDVIRGRWDQGEEEAALKSFVQMYPNAHKVRLEDKGDAKGVQVHLKDVIPGLECIALVGGDKKDRCNATLGFWRAGNVYLPESAPWLPEYEREMTNFPGYPNDDQMDMTTLALLDMHGDQPRRMQYESVCSSDFAGGLF